MAENKHTIGDLHQMQSLPLSAKISMTKRRIKDWYEYWDGQVYVSFSGGKDSTVLADLVINQCGYDDVPLVFVDTGLEYPEIREHVKSYGDKVVWLKPKKNFKQVIEECGYPFISKEVSYAVQYAKFEEDGTPNACMKKMLGLRTNDDGSKKAFQLEKYKFLLEAPFPLSERCCRIMKKSPSKSYEHETGYKPILGTMASESRMRTNSWIKSGCNAFDDVRPTSQPMSFWTEQDVLLYIKTYNIPICSVYGDVVEDIEVNGQCDGQMQISDYSGMEIFDLGRPLLKTTGVDRTGCMYCGYGCNQEKPGEGRFERMKITHPKQYDYIMRPKEQGGLNYKEVIDWLNEHGNLNIKY